MENITVSFYSENQRDLMEIKKQEMMKTKTGEIARLPKSICRRIEDGRPDVKRLARLNELPEMPQAPPANCGKLHLVALH